MTRLYQRISTYKNMTYSTRENEPRKCTVRTRNPHSQGALSTQLAIREIPTKIRTNSFKEIGIGEDSRQWCFGQRRLWDRKLLEHFRMVIYQCPSNLKFLTIQSGNYASSNQQRCPGWLCHTAHRSSAWKGENWKQPPGHQRRHACTNVDVFTLWNRTELENQERMTPLMRKAKRIPVLAQIQLTLGCELLESTYRQIFFSSKYYSISNHRLLVELYSDKPPSSTFPHCSRATCTCLKKPQEITQQLF